MTINWMKAAAAVAATAVPGIAAASGTPPTASATISSSQVSPTTYQYNLTLTDAAGSPNTIGTFWYSWVPGKDFMDSSPTSIVAPTGWTDSITGGGTGDGYAIRFLASSSAYYVQPGGTLPGFSYVSTDTPAMELGNSNFYPTTPVLTSVAYDAGAFSDAGTTFVATPTAVPEPASIALAAPALLLLARRRRAA